MDGFGFDATSFAGQGISESPDYLPTESPGQSLVVTLRLPPALLQLFTHSGGEESEDDIEDNEGESLDDSSEDDFEGDSIGKFYGNSYKKIFYDSDDEFEVVDPNEDDKEQIVYQSIESDEENSKWTVSQSPDDDDNKPDDRSAVGDSTTQADRPENLVRSSTSKLLASCLDTDQPFLYDYLAQRSALAVEFLKRNQHIMEQFLTQYPDFVIQFLRRNQEQARTLFIEDPRWYVEQHLNKCPYLLENYLKEHPEYVERFINANPVYFDQYLIRHPEFAINYLHYNRLPRGYGLAPCMFGVTNVVAPPLPSIRTPSPVPASLLSLNSSHPAVKPPPPPPLAQPADQVGRKSPTQKPAATNKPPTKLARRSQHSLPKGAPVEVGRKTHQRPPDSSMAPMSSPIPPSAEGPITPDSAPKRTNGFSRSSSVTAAAAVAASNGSSSNSVYKVLLTSAYGQSAGQFMSYPAPGDLLAASRKQDASTKGSWRLFEEDRAIKHMLDVRDEAQLAGEFRFREVSRRLVAEGIERGFFAVKNYWNRIGRARSGFDERKNKTAPLATSKQGKAFRQSEKAKGPGKEKRGKDVRVDSEEDEDDEGYSEEYSVYSEEEIMPPPPPPPPPPPVPAPAPAPQMSVLKRPADYDDAALARAQSYGTRPKKQKTG